MYDKNKQLIDGCTCGNLDLVKEAIDRGADVNILGVPLFNAVYQNHLKVVKYLLAKGSKLVLEDFLFWEKSPLNNSFKPLNDSLKLVIEEIIRRNGIEWCLTCDCKVLREYVKELV